MLLWKVTSFQYINVKNLDNLAYLQNSEILSTFISKNNLLVPFFSGQKQKDFFNERSLESKVYFYCSKFHFFFSFFIKLPLV